MPIFVNGMFLTAAVKAFAISFYFFSLWEVKTQILTYFILRQTSLIFQITARLFQDSYFMLTKLHNRLNNSYVYFVIIF